MNALKTAGFGAAVFLFYASAEVDERCEAFFLGFQRSVGLFVEVTAFDAFINIAEIVLYGFAAHWLHLRKLRLPQNRSLTDLNCLYIVRKADSSISSKANTDILHQLIIIRVKQVYIGISALVYLHLNMIIHH